MSPECKSLLLDAVRDPSTCLKLSLKDWDNLLRLVRRANLLGRLAEQIDRSGSLDRVPEPVRPHLVSALMLSRHQRQAVIWEARHIGDALRSLDLPVILLKGAAYSMAGLNAAAGRLYGDVDILVPADRIAEVEAALMLHGWTSRQTDPYDDRYYRRWMHELPPMVNLKRGTVIDVHHNILPRTARNHPSVEKLLSAAVPLAEAPFHVLSPCDMVIHAATHLFHEGELNNGLRDLLDLDALLKEFSGDPAFWQALPVRARELGLAWPLKLAFRYLARFLGVNVPADTHRSLDDVHLNEAMLDRMYLPAFLPDHVLCDDWNTAIARGMLYVRGHWLRMPMHLLALHLGRKAFMRLYKNTSRSL